MFLFFAQGKEAVHNDTPDESNGGAKSHSVQVKLERKIFALSDALSKMNKRIGDEEIVDSSDESSLSDCSIGNIPEINTRYFQRDAFFGSTYYYITNVNLSLTFIMTFIDIKFNGLNIDFS